MSDRIDKSVLRYLVLGIFFCLMPALSWAVLAVAPTTAVVSGRITKIETDHSVGLDNGMVYSPARDGLVVDLPVGGAVTLRYIVNTDGGKNVFVEYAPGMNSLQNSNLGSSQNK